MIINPFPMFGWNSTFKGDIKHVAMAVDVATVGAHKTSNLHYRVSGDGLRWHAVPLQGDLASYTTSNGGPGAFEPRGFVRFKDAWYAFGGIWTGASQNEGAVFRTEDGRVWDRVSTGFDSEGPTARRHFLYGDAGDDWLLLSKDWGGLAWTDGSTWADRSDVIGYTTTAQALAARGVLVVEGGVVVVGSTTELGGFEIKTADDPAGTFADHGAPFGTNNVQAVRRGNIALIIAHYNPPLSAQRSAYAPLDNISTWGDANFDVTHFVNNSFYALGRWYAGSQATWSQSEGAAGVPGVGGWEAADVPWAEAGIQVQTGYEADDRAYVHFGNGQVAFSDDGEAFTVVANTNLAAKPYFACAA